MMHKKDMIFLSILIACSESVVLFYFCSAKSPRSFLCMMISYALLLIFPLNIFLASLREHRTGTSLYVRNYRRKFKAATRNRTVYS